MLTEFQKLIREKIQELNGEIPNKPCWKAIFQPHYMMFRSDKFLVFLLSQSCQLRVSYEILAYFEALMMMMM